VDPIFRGCTRPALILGVPLIPLVGAVAPIALLSVWIAAFVGIYAWVWSAAVLVPLVVAFGVITQGDDQRLLQWLQLARLMVRHRSWRARSMRRYSPCCDGGRGRQ
jgi:type IV secretory pathway VirB3-like protein